MLIIRIAKAALVAAIALHASLVVFGNVTDYAINFSFVRNVMSMDTILPSSTIGYRAIKAPALHHAAYAVIIAAELLTAILCWIGAARLVGALRVSGVAFNSAKPFAVAGLLMGLLLWQVGFITIGGEWFGMWMSQTWNGVPSAFRLVMIVLGTLIFVALPDSDLEPTAK
jgi:predicted small integral membrane protein